MRKSFAFWFIVGIALPSSGQDAPQPQQKPAGEQVEPQREYNEHDARMWALGASAVLIERNHGRHTTLAPAQINERNIANQKKLLSEWWGVESRQDLFDIFRRMDAGMHRTAFDKWAERIDGLDKDQLLNLLEQYKGDKETLNEIIVVKKYYKELGDKSLWGWDYSRDICLCRWGYMAGYITEEEAWKRIMAVARILQSKFDSWEDLARNYLIGRQFWSYKETQDDGYLCEDALMRLLDMPSSPWNKYPWDLPLSPDAGGTQETISRGQQEQEQ